MDIDTRRHRNEAVVHVGIILLSLGPAGVKIKQLSEQKVLLNWFACDSMTILIVIFAIPKSALQRKCVYLLIVHVIYFFI